MISVIVLLQGKLICGLLHAIMIKYIDTKNMNIPIILAIFLIISSPPPQAPSPSIPNTIIQNLPVTDVCHMSLKAKKG